MSEATYNDRLFKRGLRSFFHLARFRWLELMLNRYEPSVDLVLELGCFDARSLDYMTSKPKKYIGFDANWEGGIDLARPKYKEDSSIIFYECTQPEDFKLSDDQIATCLISLETLEHLPEKDVASYLEEMSKIVNGYYSITVPNEKGLIFFAKHVMKFLLYRSSENYSMREIFWATFGQLDKVERNEHKGIDYSVLYKNLCFYLDPIEVVGIPFKRLPCSMNTQVGFVFKSKISRKLIKVDAMCDYP